jgi:biotin synthase
MSNMVSITNDMITGFEDCARSLLEAARQTDSMTKLGVRKQLLARGDEQGLLAARARAARRMTGDDSLIVRASLEFSNYCRQQCSFCGMTAHNKQLERYRMNEAQMRQIVRDVACLGVKDLHLTSGEDWGFRADALATVIAEAVAAGMEVTLVTGHRKVEDYQTWRDAGASRYILKVETTNEQLFHEARTGTVLMQ